MRAAQRLFVALAIPLTVTMIAVSAGAAANVQVISTDTLVTPSTSKAEHQTEVEPDTFAVGSTIVSAFQVGRIANGGAAAIGWSTSSDGGTTWANGLLPGLTKLAPVPGPYDRATDASVAYDAAHGKWLVATLAMTGSNGVAVALNASTNGTTWGNATVAATKGSGLDKSWIACDNTPTSPYFGHCYIEYDVEGSGDLIYNTTSADGGMTWSPPQTTADSVHGIGGQPVVRPDGTVVVPADNAAQSAIISYRSTDGGQTWSAATTVTPVQHHAVHASMRVNKLPSAEVDSAGTVYAAWEDCRFRSRCSSNDIVIASTSDGVTWAGPVRVPIDAVTSTVDHFIPGLAVDSTTSGPSAHLALTYYFFPVANCSGTACQLQVGQISSTGGLSGWGSPTTLSSAPMQNKWLANTSQGRMVGDYISTSYVSGHPVGVFAVATAPDSQYHESMAAGSTS
ncbi:MAG: exo-alpha-sialidase [Acidimicrobiia bacterium]|nr:exo-alpha-sialidase [Acidimicrobiia bacterium]